MALNVTLNFPANLEARLLQTIPDLNAAVKEAFALELFRCGKLAHQELSAILTLDRFETNALLKRNGVFQGSPTAADIEADRQALHRVLGTAG